MSPFELVLGYQTPLFPPQEVEVAPPLSSTICTAAGGLGRRLELPFFGLAPDPCRCALALAFIPGQPLLLHPPLEHHLICSNFRLSSSLPLSPSVCCSNAWVATGAEPQQSLSSCITSCNQRFSTATSMLSDHSSCSFHLPCSSASDPMRPSNLPDSAPDLLGSATHSLVSPLGSALAHIPFPLPCNKSP